MGSPGNEKFTGAYDSRFAIEYDFERKRELAKKFIWFETYYDLCYGSLPKEQVPKGAKVSPNRKVYIGYYFQ